MSYWAALPLHIHLIYAIDDMRSPMAGERCGMPTSRRCVVTLAAAMLGFMVEACAQDTALVKDFLLRAGVPADAVQAVPPDISLESGVWRGVLRGWAVAAVSCSNSDPLGAVKLAVERHLMMRASSACMQSAQLAQAFQPLELDDPEARVAAIRALRRASVSLTLPVIESAHTLDGRALAVAAIRVSDVRSAFQVKSLRLAALLAYQSHLECRAAEAKDPERVIAVLQSSLRAGRLPTRSAAFLATAHAKLGQMVLARDVLIDVAVRVDLSACGLSADQYIELHSAAVAINNPTIELQIYQAALHALQGDWLSPGCAAKAQQLVSLRHINRTNNDPAP